MGRALFLSFLISFVFNACTPSAPATSSPTPTPSPSQTPATKPSKPSQTKKPSRTPNPTPTLPLISEINCIPESAGKVSGIVTTVRDGDTIEVSVQGLVYIIRYLGINTPETDERMGSDATNRNRELVSGERVTLIRDPKDEDRDIYGRFLRYVIVDDIFVNRQLVREGFAFLFISGHSCAKEFFFAYEAAKADKVGLFAPTPAPKD